MTSGRWHSTGTPVSFSNKIDRHDITEILLKVALSTINETNHETSSSSSTLPPPPRTSTWLSSLYITYSLSDRHDRDCMVVGFTNTYAISTYQH